MLVVGTASFTLADGAKQARLVGCSGIYLSKSCLVAIFIKVENLGAYLYIALVTFFVLLLQYCMLLCLPPTGGNYPMNRTRLGLFLS